MKYTLDHLKIFLEEETNESPLELEYFLRSNNINIAHIRKSNNILIDSIFQFSIWFSTKYVNYV